MKNRYWIAGFAVVIAICAIIWLFVGTGDDSSVVGVYQDGVLLYKLDLTQVSEAYEITVEYNGSKNVILVEPNDISVSHADCPDNICVEHGSLGHRTPIVCLPNRLVIKWLDNDNTELDAVA